MAAITSSPTGSRWDGILNSKVTSRLTGRRVDDAALVKARGRGGEPLQPGFRRGAPRQGSRRIHQEVTTAVPLCPHLSRLADCAAPWNALSPPGIDDHIAPAVGPGPPRPARQLRAPRPVLAGDHEGSHPVWHAE